MSIIIVLVFVLVLGAILSKFHPQPVNTESLYENTEDLAPESAIVVEFLHDKNVEKTSNKSKKKYYYHNNKKSKKKKSAINN